MQKMLNWAGRGAVGEVRRRKKDEGRWITEVRGLKTDDGLQKTEVGGRRSEEKFA
jgi:hypothetical protein